MLRVMASPKVRMINVRLAPDKHDDFKLACELRGGSMSSILHQFIVRTIREEKERDPKAFQTAPKGIEVAPRSSTGIPLMNHKHRRTADSGTAKKQKNKVA